MDATYEAINEMSKYLATIGVTFFVATTVTSALSKIEKAVKNAADCMEKGLEGAKLLGSYVEGPYIANEYKGAHPEEFIRELNIHEIENIIGKARNTVKIITIAPEKPQSIDIIKCLTERGIKVSLGHSNATYEETMQAIQNGATIAVHIYNGMRELHHREVGLLGAVLNNDDIKAEMICDGTHVSIPAMQIVMRCKNKEDIVLITDCMMAGGLKDGDYILGELNVKVSGGIVRTESGSLASSNLKLIDGIKNMHTLVGVSFEDSLKMATINAAKSIGVDSEIGTIESGKSADIIAIDDDFNVIFTMINGKIIYDKT
jgi:N-acetylglucosamine-6-phosphate deacetylase